jgi:hypothetical protein
MKVTRSYESGTFVLEVDRAELTIVSNAFNEVCNGIASWEFATRLGSPRDQALEMLGVINGALGAP